MFKKVLTPVDLDETAVAPLHYACLFARHFGSEVTLMYADEVAALFGGYDPEFLAYHIPATDQIAREEEALRNLAARYLTAGPVPETLAIPGPPVSSILSVAKSKNADLIIMGTRGDRSWRRALSGSVADGVVRAATQPVLVVPARRDGRPYPETIQRVVCPVNFTGASREALVYATRLAEAFAAELLLVHVHEADGIDSDAVHDRFRSYVPQDLRGRCKIRELVLRGGAAERVLECVEDQNAELLVMGTQRKTLRAETIIGTTSERLLRFSPVPVLSVTHKPVATEREKELTAVASS
jgi:nucleotide-binding universal stress UspA family protein